MNFKDSLIKKSFYDKYLASGAGIKGREGAYLVLDNGRRILDAVSSGGVNFFGIDSLDDAENSGSTDSGSELPRVRQALLNILPPRLSELHFTEGRMQALKEAMMLAVQYWQRQNQERDTFISFGAYGRYLSECIERINASVPGMQLKAEILPFPAGTEGDTTIYHRENDIIDRLEIMLDDEPEKYAAIIMEPLVDTRGMEICSEEFMQKIQWSHRQFDTLLIFDEHQTGFGRTGQLFGFKTAQVEPDILCLGRGITGGFFNRSAVVYSVTISETGGVAAIPVPERKNTTQEAETALRALELYAEYEANFSAMQHLHEKYIQKLKAAGVFENFRIKGTIAAFDLKEEYKIPEDKLAAAAFEAGLLINPAGRTIYLMPPYGINEEEAARMYTLLSTLPFGKLQHSPEESEKYQR